MSTSGVISTNKKYGSHFWVKWAISGSQSIADNKTTISWSCGLTPGEQYYSNAIKMSEVTIAGVKVYVGGTYSNIKDYKDRTFASGTLELRHNPDGTKSFTVEAFSGWLYGNGDYTAAATSFTLPTIPRASTVSAPSTGTLGMALKIAIGRKSTSFADKLYYRIGSNSEEQITAYDGKTSYDWTPPVELASNAPNSTQLVVTIIAKTYNGSTYVGRSECAVTLAIPASEVPSLTMAVSDGENVNPNYGGYFVQLRSKIAVTITGTGVRGSTIKSYSIKVGSAAGLGNIYAASASSGTTDFLPISGTVWVTCTVTDSRGRTASKSVDYKVVPYSTPTIAAISATRCAQDGTVDRMGAYAKITFSATITKLYGNNTAAYKVQYRAYGTTDAWTEVATPAAGDYTPQNITTVFPVDTAKRYTVRVVATDAFVSSYSSL